MTAEEQRLQQERDRTAYWSRWGPYLSERQWGSGAPCEKITLPMAMPRCRNG